MRITIEPTAGNVPGQHSVTVGTYHDDVTLQDAIDLMRAALMAWGYSEQGIAEYLDIE